MSLFKSGGVLTIYISFWKQALGIRSPTRSSVPWRSRSCHLKKDIVSDVRKTKEVLLTFRVCVDRLGVCLLVKAFQPVGFTVALHILEDVCVLFSSEPAVVPIETDWLLALEVCNRWCRWHTTLWVLFYYLRIYHRCVCLFLLIL